MSFFFPFTFSLSLLCNANSLFCTLGCLNRFHNFLQIFIDFLFYLKTNLKIFSSFNLQSKMIFVLTFDIVSPDVISTEFPEEPKRFKKNIFVAILVNLAQTLRGYFFSVRPQLEAIPIPNHLKCKVQNLN